jgi:streptogrisin C
MLVIRGIHVVQGTGWRYIVRLTRGFGVWVAVVLAIAVLASASYAAAPGEGGDLFASPFSTPPPTPLISAGSLVANEEAVFTGEGISAARARQDLAIQGQVEEARLPLRIETALGAAYAGVWFDAAAGQLDVGVTSSASRQAVRRIAARAGLAGAVVETPVRSTWAALIAAEGQWNKRLESLRDSGEATTEIDPSRNAVVVTLGSAVPPLEHATLLRAAAAASANVVVDGKARPTVRGEPMSVKCENPFTSTKAHCEKTLVSGVGILVEYESGKFAGCTAGPLLRAGIYTRMLTAGHCFTSVETQGFSTAKVYSEYPNEPGLKEIGNEDGYSWGESGDFGSTYIESSSAFLQGGNTPVPALTAEWSVKPTTPNAVFAVINPIVGYAVCHEGATSGEQCGKITGIQGYAPYQVETNACGEQGDSGGPFVFGAATSTSKTPIWMEGIATRGNLYQDCATGELAETWFQPLGGRHGILGSFDLTLLNERNQSRETIDHAGAKLKALPTSKTIAIADVYYKVGNSSVSVACNNGLGEGEATGTETVGKTAIVFNGCMGQKGKEECTVKSVGAKSEGEVVTKTLKGELGEVASSEASTEAGFLLEPATGKTVSELAGNCLGSSTELLGSLAAEVFPAETSTKVLELYAAEESTSKPVIKAITVKAGNVKPKLELGGSEAAAQAYLEVEFSGDVELT